MSVQYIDRTAGPILIWLGAFVLSNLLKWQPSGHFILKRNMFPESLGQEPSIRVIKRLDPYIWLTLLSTDNGPNKVALCSGGGGGKWTLPLQKSLVIKFIFTFKPGTRRILFQKGISDYTFLHLLQQCLNQSSLRLLLSQICQMFFLVPSRVSWRLCFCQSIISFLDRFLPSVCWTDSPGYTNLNCITGSCGRFLGSQNSKCPIF